MLVYRVVDESEIALYAVKNGQCIKAEPAQEQGLL